MDEFKIRVVPRPWNKGKLVGQKAPLKLKEIWAIRVRLQVFRRTRELALFNLGIDSKLRACDLLKLRVRDISHGERIAARAIVVQQKTSRPVQFEITESTRSALAEWIRLSGLASDGFLFPSRVHASPHLSTRQYARIVNSWVEEIGLDPAAYGTHSIRRTKPSLIYRRTKNLRAVQPFGPKEVETMSQTVSPSTSRCYGLARVSRAWSVSRAGVYRFLKGAPSPAIARRRPGPTGPCPDADLADHIRREIEASDFHGEGYRKLWARLRVAGVRSSPRRVRRVMGENRLLAPHRVGRNQEKTHDGTIVTDKVNEMWGTDMSQTVTIEEGRAYVFVAVEHANSEIIGSARCTAPVRPHEAREYGSLPWHRGRGRLGVSRADRGVTLPG